MTCKKRCQLGWSNGLLAFKIERFSNLKLVKMPYNFLFPTFSSNLAICGPDMAIQGGYHA
ncbi:hypothetical protein BDE40_1574 [Litoreibacter halocynthiae]|uniref:Uncharacterized protein n=1 Tax=Litoreibacter halocynthiae TaxID=1242689 RepID=A0A4R7LJQ1_9RHOB|nr:hypothetical protein BDE40_1574 [Litoreibacter halocynthiae]